MRVFPRWAEHLGIDATLTGIDLPLDDTAEHYRDVVRFIKEDPLSLGALVTTHKLNLYKAALAIRKQDANERMEQEALLELYMSALGMVAAPPED